MIILSLFDGISGARVALDRAGINVDKYYASEIDKYAIQIAMKNYPDTIQLGNVTKWREWDIEPPDLIVAGFPCQAWSVAGKQKGLNDPRGKLAIVLLDVFNHYKPKWFLFENVKMKKENLDFMDELFGVKHIQINSALVSAQNRQRCYWTNIPGIEQPEDKGILLKDIIETSPDDEFNSEPPVNHVAGSGRLNNNYKSQANAIHDTNKKSPTICAGTHGYALGHIQRPCKPKVLIND